jgi:Na+-translocating ferredoxin:NAD+ oxidoreductase RNF subunit RnfB
MCQLLLSEGCDWCQEACFCAARRGHLQTLRFLRDNGCTWDVSGVSSKTDMCTAAVASGTADILEYMAVEEQIQFEASTLQWMLTSAELHSNAAAVLWIEQRQQQQQQEQQQQQQQQQHDAVLL